MGFQKESRAKPHQKTLYSVGDTPQRPGSAQRSHSRDKSKDRERPKSKDSKERSGVDGKGFQKDEKYTAFTSTRQISGLMVLTQKPVSGKLVNG